MADSKISDLTAITTLDGTEEFVVADSGATKKITAADIGSSLVVPASSADPVAEWFGAADTGFEFDSSSLSGLTALGTPDTEAADTVYAGRYYVADNASGVAWCGRYLSGLTTPFTGITHLVDFMPFNNGNQAGLIVGPASLGALDTVSLSDSSPTLHVDNYTSPTGSQGNAFGKYSHLRPPTYFGIVANTSTSVDYYFSYEGYVWEKIVAGRNPGNTGTLASIGIGMKSQDSAGCAAVFEFLRVWNSAKTFPTG